jgi:hypothetical protein
MQNTSHAVMAQRSEAKDSLDDFPTPPWATRGMLEHILPTHELKEMTCLEPACNRGFMSFVLQEYFRDVTSSDVFDYGYGVERDFLSGDYAENSFDWVITNPPFRLAEDFFHEAQRVAKRGVALLTRTVFIESVGRYERLFSVKPPTVFAQFSERVAMVKGRIDRKASTATGYSWLIWDFDARSGYPRLDWIPPCRKSLERSGDYELPVERQSSPVSLSLKQPKPTIQPRQPKQPKPTSQLKQMKQTIQLKQTDQLKLI